MYISGSAVTPYLVRVKPDFKIDTKLALTWVQSSNGQWSAVDRGIASDVYKTTVTLTAKQPEIEQFINAVEANRLNGANYFSLSGFESTEHIFGEEIDYTSPLNVTVLSIKELKQKSWKVWSIAVVMQLLSPIAFASTTPSFVPLLNVDVNIKKTNDYTVNKIESYQGSYTYLDHSSDSGIIEIDCLLSLSDTVKIKRFNEINRSDSIALTQAHMPGISYPFGTTRPTWPLSVKMLDLEDNGWFGITHRMITLRLAEVI